MTVGCWITGCLYALVSPFLLLFTYTGFFIAYIFILSKFDRTFPHVDSTTTIIYSVIALAFFVVSSFGFGGIYAFRNPRREQDQDGWSRRFTGLTEVYVSPIILIAKCAIPLAPLALSHSLKTPDLYPIAAMSAARVLLLLLSLPPFMRGFIVWVSSILDLTIDAIAIGMVYYLIIWNTPLQAYLQSLPYSLETTLRFSVIAGGIAVAFGQIYQRLIKPRLHPSQQGVRRYTALSGLELFLNLPVYFILLGLVPTVYSLSQHNISMAVVFAGISTLATTVAKLLASGFVAGVGQTIWKNMYARARGKTTASAQEARTEVVIEAEMTSMRALPPSGVTHDAVDED